MGNEKANTNKRTLWLSVEVSGCLGECAHCWAEGHPYPPMALGDIERVLEAGAQVCKSEGLSFGPFPMHDPLMHPDALEVLKLFHQYSDEKIFEPLTTPGPILAQRADWKEILEGAKELGTTTMWFCFHGMDEVHDRIAGLEGAFKLTATAVERATSLGLNCGTNLFITKPSAHQIPDIIQFFREIGIDQFSPEVCHFNAHGRGRKYQSLRPELADLLPYGQMMVESTGFARDFWSNLEQHTEGYYVNQMLTKQEPASWPDPDPINIPLDCKSNFDMRIGKAASHGPLVGNLLDDDPQAIIRKGIEGAPYSFLIWCFPGKEVPQPPELVRGWGDPDGQLVYMNHWDVYMRLSDLALGKVAR